MVDFVVTYESNLEVGQYIQPCNCADAHIQVVSGYERDAALIPFAATLSPSVVVEYWMIVVAK